MGLEAPATRKGKNKECRVEYGQCLNIYIKLGIQKDTQSVLTDPSQSNRIKAACMYRTTSAERPFPPPYTNTIVSRRPRTCAKQIPHPGLALRRQSSPQFPYFSKYIPGLGEETPTFGAYDQGWNVPNNRDERLRISLLHARSEISPFFLPVNTRY